MRSILEVGSEQLRKYINFRLPLAEHQTWTLRRRMPEKLLCRCGYTSISKWAFYIVFSDCYTHSKSEDNNVIFDNESWGMSMNQNLYPHLFQPLTIRGVTLKNRLEYAPTVVLKCNAEQICKVSFTSSTWRCWSACWPVISVCSIIWVEKMDS